MERELREDQTEVGRVFCRGGEGWRWRKRKEKVS